MDSGTFRHDEAIGSSLQKSVLKNNETMKKTLFTILFFSIALSFSACHATFQYDVYVKNDTGEPLKIAYKAPNDVRGVTEEVLTLKAGEYKKLISTIDIAPDLQKMATHTKHCTYVAEYINAFIKNDIPSSIQWCSDQVHFEKTDIQQAEFTISYTLANFGLPNKEKKLNFK